jgi:Flp pilus assembly CpaF family ATPase
MLTEHEEVLHRLVTDEVGEYVTRATTEGRVVPDELDQRQMATAIVRRELDARARVALRDGAPLLAADDEAATVSRVLTAAFAPAPGLDALLVREDVTDVFVNGFDDVRVALVDGSTERVTPFVGSDRELIEMVQTLARRGGHVEREFTESRPILDLQLPDGSRLAAAAWVTKRPYVTVRRHLLVDATQTELVGRGMYDAGVASLLRAFVTARWNVLIAGGQGVGKTTLLRAMLHECTPDERLLVLEQEPELHLESMPERHNHVLVFMERVANMEGVGAVSLADLSRAIKRFTPQRIVVGEVRGPEVIDMLEAMTQGIAGSMCTLHADSSLSVFPRLPIYARSGGRAWASDDVLSLAAMALQVVVFVGRDRQGRRVVAEIRHVEGFDASVGQAITNPWFVAGPDGRAARNPDAPIPVRLLEALVAHGYQPELHGSDHEPWTAGREVDGVGMGAGVAVGR